MTFLQLGFGNIQCLYSDVLEPNIFSVWPVTLSYMLVYSVNWDSANAGCCHYYPWLYFGIISKWDNERLGFATEGTLDVSEVWYLGMKAIVKVNGGKWKLVLASQLRPSPSWIFTKGGLLHIDEVKPRALGLGRLGTSFNGGNLDTFIQSI